MILDTGHIREMRPLRVERMNLLVGNNRDHDKKFLFIPVFSTCQIKESSRGIDLLLIENTLVDEI